MFTCSIISIIVGITDTILYQTQAKIIIDNPNPVYGDEPYTNQYGECGAEGQYIHLNPKPPPRQHTR